MLLMNSAKSPIESRSTRASRACGAFGRSLAPVLLVWGLETGLKDLADLIDLATSFLAAATAGFGHLGDLRAKVPPNDMSRGVAGEKNHSKPM